MTTSRNMSNSNPNLICRLHHWEIFLVATATRQWRHNTAPQSLASGRATTHLETPTSPRVISAWKNRSTPQPRIRSSYCRQRSARVCYWTAQNPMANRDCRYPGQRLDPPIDPWVYHYWWGRKLSGRRGWQDWQHVCELFKAQCIVGNGSLLLAHIYRSN